MALNNLQLQALAKSPNPGKHTDGQGLYLNVTPKGGMYWQWRIRTPRETIVSYGTFPEVGLAEARARHAQAREQRRNGVDPNAAKRMTKLAQRVSRENTFEAIAREWFDVHKGEWAPKHAEKVIRRLEMDVFPRIGRLPITDITPLLLLDVARRIEARGVHETARRAIDTSSQVFGTPWSPDASKAILAPICAKRSSQAQGPAPATPLPDP
ncbi:MAG: integrase arm-type DNA-binding domain-containing protein [Ramlibacter sp.]|nr:integrase arm-type DNA-binding domain-containing protein [Ramlibacter sp.]